MVEEDRANIFFYFGHPKPLYYQMGTFLLLQDMGNLPLTMHVPTF